jgi:hypothetical protein
MNCIAILSLVALTAAALAVIHAASLRRAARNVLCRLIRSLRHAGKALDHALESR